MCILVVSKFLFLLSNINSNFDCLFNISDCSIEFESPLWFFGLVINLSEQIVNQLVSQGFNFYFGNHFNHIRNHLFAFSNIELQGFVVLLTLFVVLGCATPLRFSFIVLCDSQMFINIFLVSLQNDFGILIHDLVRLSNNKGLFPFATEDQEFNSFFLKSSGFTIFGDHQSTLRKLRFRSKDMLGLLRVV